MQNSSPDRRRSSEMVMTVQPNMTLSHTFERVLPPHANTMGITFGGQVTMPSRTHEGRGKGGGGGGGGGGGEVEKGNGQVRGKGEDRGGQGT